MSGTPRRSRAEHWLLPLLLLASTAAHGLGFVLFAVPDPVAVASEAQRTRVQAWVAPGTDQTMRYALVTMKDPSLIALPTPRGFSAKMLARATGVGYQAYLWNVRPVYLLPVAAASWDSLLPLRDAADAVRAAAVKLTGAPDDEPVAARGPAPTADQSVVRFGGGLGPRAVVQPLVLGKVASATALRPTVVRLGVERAGTVRFATVERGSGNEAVDAQALRWARQTRFEPVGGEPGGGLAWGMATFYWATAPAAAGEANGGGAAPVKP